MGLLRANPYAASTPRNGRVKRSSPRPILHEAWRRWGRPCSSRGASPAPDAKASAARARPAAWRVLHRALTTPGLTGPLDLSTRAADRARPCFRAPSPDEAEVLDAADPTPRRP